MKQLFTLWACSSAILSMSITRLDSIEAANLSLMSIKDIAPVNCSNYYESVHEHRAMASKLDRVCGDCYQIYRKPEIYARCKENCYKNDYFPNCLKSLLLDDEVKKYQRMIMLLNGVNPNSTIITPVQKNIAIH